MSTDDAEKPSGELGDAWGDSCLQQVPIGDVPVTGVSSQP